MLHGHRQLYIKYKDVEDVHKDIANDVVKRFDTLNFEIDRTLPIGINKKVIGLMKDELGGKMMTEFVALRQKIYCCITQDGSRDRKAKKTKKSIIKRRFKFEVYKKCLKITKLYYYSKGLKIKHIMYLGRRSLIL